MIVDAIMTQERWSALSEMERGLLKSLGIAPEVPKVAKVKVTNPITIERRNSTRNTAPDEYYVQIHKTCGCCQKKTTQEGRMVKRRHTDTYLSLLCEEIPAGEVFKMIKAVSVVCNNCDVELDKLSKEELISMVKTLREMTAKKAAS